MSPRSGGIATTCCCGAGRSCRRSVRAAARSGPVTPLRTILCELPTRASRRRSHRHRWTARVSLTLPLELPLAGPRTRTDRPLEAASGVIDLVRLAGRRPPRSVPAWRSCSIALTIGADLRRRCSSRGSLPSWEFVQYRRRSRRAAARPAARSRRTRGRPRAERRRCRKSGAGAPSSVRLRTSARISLPELSRGGAKAFSVFDAIT